jgi:FkbM family methyltransferase
MRFPPLTALRPLLGRMRSISFSQYGEDILLHPLNPGPQGFYIDVGAYHPWRGSNTYKLYLKGWCGLTIEPNPDAARAFQRARPRDTHLMLGVASQAGMMTYHRFKDAKFNSFELDEYRRTLPRDGEAMELPCLPLSEIIEAYAPARHIDLLSIDCEGSDELALTSLDWTRVRPTAVIVEDTLKPRKRRLAQFLEAKNYACIGQALFSFVFIDTDAVRNPSRASGFDLEHTQLAEMFEDLQ